MLHFPARDFDTVDCNAAGWDAALLEEAFRFAAERNSTQLLVAFEGRVVREQYWNSAPDDTGDIASAQKSFVAVLVGIAQERGLLSIHDRMIAYLGRGWTRLDADAEERLTIEHLLTMTTGMNDGLEAKGTPGATWHYNTGAYQCLKRVLPKVAGMPLEELSRDWLSGPLGMRHTAWVPRANMTYLDGEPMTGLFSNVRDMARLGILLLGEGDWNGRAILADKAYLARMIGPSQELNPSYGYLWWLNGQLRHMVPFDERVHDGSLIPDAPRDMVMCLGAADQKIYVVPSWSTVIARRGGSGAADPAAARSGFDREFWQRLTAARL